MKKEQILTFLPGELLKVCCDGKVVVIKDMSDCLDVPLYSRRLEYGEVRLKATKKCPRCGLKLIWLDKKVHKRLLSSQWFCSGCAYYKHISLSVNRSEILSKTNF